MSTWFLFVFFVFFDLLFAAVRSSLVQVRLPSLVNLREQNEASVERTISLLEKPTLRPALRAGVTIIHFLLVGAFGLAYLSDFSLVMPLWVALLCMLGAAVLLLALEFLVEGIILRRPEAWAVRLSFLGSLFEWFLRPVSWLLSLLQPVPPGAQRSMATVTEDELKNWVESEHSEGLEQGEREMIYSIFHFSDTLCREIMVPRMDILALEVDLPLPDAVALISRSGHSRVPVYDDEIDNVVGVLYAKDLLQINLNKHPDSLRGLLRPAYFVPEAKKVDELLREMQQKGVHIAVVVDEYGGMAGLVTLEDIVEEIVGDIRDEYDQSEELPFQKITEDEYKLLGRIDLEDLNDLLGTHLTRDVADTLGGLIYGELGHVPVEGEQVAVDGWVLTVEQVLRRRIRTVRAVRRTEPEPEEGDKNGAD